ncbi:DUF7672 family protein [Paucihalobacter sp.]|uniref:DUF7672 family protein n=1 Tax=Paucihalobacter sp. TaxID=2850405 RepID=UPI002FE2AE6A
MSQLFFSADFICYLFTMLKLYFIGLGILIVAIIANIIIGKIGLKSWYDFLELLTIQGWGTFKIINFWDYLWLFFGYPLILSLGYLAGLNCYKFLFN